GSSEDGAYVALWILRDILEQEKDGAALAAKVRPAVLQAMAKIKPRPPNLEAILRRFLGDPDDVTRRTAAQEIGKLKDQSAVSAEVIPALIEAYTNPKPDTTPFTQRGIITALAKFGDTPAALHAVEQALQDRHQMVRVRAVELLTRRTGQDYSHA